MFRFARAAWVVVVLVVVGCGGGPDDEEPGTSATSSPQPIQSVSADAYVQLRGHLDHLGMLPQDSIPAVLPQHRQMVLDILTQMNRDLGSTNMNEDVTWRAMVDSIQADLDSMRSMEPAGLAAIVPDHRARVERVMSMHARMMGRM